MAKVTVEIETTGRDESIAIATQGFVGRINKPPEVKARSEHFGLVIFVEIEGNERAAVAEAKEFAKRIEGRSQIKSVTVRHDDSLAYLYSKLGYIGHLDQIKRFDSPPSS